MAPNVRCICACEQYLYIIFAAYVHIFISFGNAYSNGSIKTIKIDTLINSTFGIDLIASRHIQMRPKLSVLLAHICFFCSKYKKKLNLLEFNSFPSLKNVERNKEKNM